MSDDHAAGRAGPAPRTERAVRAARRRVVVVGASLAGLTTAEALRAEGSEDEILVVGAEPDLPYVRPPLSKQVLHGSWEPEATALRTAAELDDLDIRVRTGTRATGLDPVARIVQCGRAAIPYDVLVIATGVGLRAVPGAIGLRTLDDARVLRDAVRRAGHVVVVGTGVLGSEIASAVRAADRDVTLVGRSATLSFGAVGRLLSDRLTTLHRTHGVDLRLGAAVLGVEDGRVALSDGGTVTGDLVVGAIGGDPATGWLDGSGIDHADGVRCDADGRVLRAGAGAGAAVPATAEPATVVPAAVVPDVWAVGDVAAWTDPATGVARRVEHQTNAMEQALSVAATIVHGTSAEPRRAFFWSELHGTRIQAYGAFDERVPLRVRSAEPAADRTPERVVLTATEPDGLVTGVVGWNAARAFRDARSLVDFPAVVRA